MALKSKSSWIDSANYATDFPLENLPFGVFRAGRRAHIGVAIGERILDLTTAFEDGLITEETVTEETLNALMAKGREAATALRERVQGLLTDGAAERQRTAKHLVARRDAEMLLPCAIGDYSDFYASIHHATNVGSMFRPDNPLLANYKYVPIGYHGRASSIVISETEFRRPHGQTRDDSAELPSFEPTKRLDYEMEVGLFIGRGNDLGTPISIDEAEAHIFGLCLVNDWSARDIQAWEYQPLGPFLAKNFATTISPWIVTPDALEPFRVPVFERAEGDPAPLPHLAQTAEGGFDITVEVWLRSETPRQFPRHVLDGRPARRPPRLERLQPPSRRSPGQRHSVRPGARVTRLSPRTGLARLPAGVAPERRAAPLPRGRRRSHPERLLRARRPAHRLW